MLELATAADRAAINRLARQVHQMHVSWRPDIYRMPEELYPEERFLAAVQSRELYAAKLDGIVAGYAAVRVRSLENPGTQPRRIMLIDEFCVDQSLRRQGIGTRMILDIRALARAFGCTDLQLSVYPQNDDAVSFYQKMGFMIQSITMQRKA